MRVVQLAARVRAGLGGPLCSDLRAVRAGMLQAAPHSYARHSSTPPRAPRRRTQRTHHLPTRGTHRGAVRAPQASITCCFVSCCGKIEYDVTAHTRQGNPGLAQVCFVIVLPCLKL